MTDKTDHLLVLSTCPGSITAKRIANDLVESKFAACVQVVPNIQSFFRWGGSINSAEEHLLLIKTTAERYQQVQDRICTLHPYELPEIVAVPIITGLAGYLAWVEKNTETS